MAADWKTPKLGRLDLAWLAGLLEGEGSFALHYYPMGRSRTDGSDRSRTDGADKTGYVVPSIELHMVDRDVVKRAGFLIGGGQSKPRVQKRVEGRQTQFVWRVNGRRAAHLMRLLLPHMGKRRSLRICRILKCYETKVGPNGALGFVRGRPRSLAEGVVRHPKR